MAKRLLSFRFEKLKEKGEKALVTYFMVGYPNYEKSKEIFEQLADGGADIIEIGMPFSDPIADGPTIQVAHEVALKNGIRFKHVLDLSMRLKEIYPEIPLLLMTYYNPVFKIGMDDFCKISKNSGIDGFIIPDLPPEESEELKQYTFKYDLSLVMLASPTSDRRRLEKICTITDDMTYFVSITGTTGFRDQLPLERIRRKVEEYRHICKKPVVVGFGISSQNHVKSICEFADGVVIGSLLIKAASEGEDVTKIVKNLKRGTL